MRRAAAALCLLTVFGAATPALAKDTLIRCGNLVGASYGHRIDRSNGMPTDDGLVDRKILIDLAVRQGYPLVRLSFRDGGGPPTDTRDEGATVHASFADARQRPLHVVAEYQSRREEYVLELPGRAASLRLTRTQFGAGGWLWSVFAGECSVGS